MQDKCCCECIKLPYILLLWFVEYFFPDRLDILQEISEPELFVFSKQHPLTAEVHVHVYSHYIPE